MAIRLVVAMPRAPRVALMHTDQRTGLWLCPAPSAAASLPWSCRCRGEHAPNQACSTLASPRRCHTTLWPRRARCARTRRTRPFSPDPRCGRAVHGAASVATLARTRALHHARTGPRRSITGADPPHCRHLKTPPSPPEDPAIVARMTRCSTAKPHRLCRTTPRPPLRLCATTTTPPL